MELRLLIDPPASGAWNMAVDELLLQNAQEEGAACLRFYLWETATQSLGYFQKTEHRQQHVESRDLPWVRRGTGGGALIHHHDVTYSMAAPVAVRGDTRQWYDAAHAALIEALRQWGVRAEFAVAAHHSPPPFLCFQRRASGDVLCGAAKIAGSAQRKRQGALLQHGSVLLARSPHAPQLDGLKELSGCACSPQDLIAEWSARLAHGLGAALSSSELRESERQRIQQGPLERHLSPDWKHRR